jgi:hypothetical protein
VKTGVYVIDAEQYHRDEIPGVDVPCLSASIAKVLHEQSPRHAYARHPKLGGRFRPASEAMDEGTALHTMLLGSGREVFPVQFDDYRTKAAKEQRDTARAEGKIPLRAKDFDRLVRVAHELRDGFRDAGISLEGDVEQTMIWVERADDGTEVQCKAMLDLVDWTTGRILDLKKTENAHPDAIARHVDDYGYAIQEAAYRSGFGEVRPVLRGREDFSFAFYELDPVIVTEARLDGTYLHIGEQRWRRAVNTWARCLRTGNWPGYPARPVSPPPWVARREEERALEEGGAQEGRAA